MILSGKDLFNYRVKQIKNFGVMFVGVFAMVFFMALMCIAYC